MTLEQGLAFGILLGTIGLFVWGRLAYDLVALLGLLAAIAVGIVPAKSAFEGFSNEIVIIIAAALLISAAVAKSGVIETLMRPIVPRLKTLRTQVPVLVTAVTLLSIVTKNVGALAIFMPVALQLARRTGTAPSYLLMPMAFGSLLGGTVTLVGTSPNILISEVRSDVVGKPFAMFDYTPVGLSIAVLGVIFLCFGYRMLPGGRKAAATMDAAFNMEEYTTEARIPAGSPAVGRTVAELEAMSDGDVAVSTIIRERFRRFAPLPEWTLREGDVVLLDGESDALERLVARARLHLAGEEFEAAGGSGEVSVVEGVITSDSSLVGHTPAQLDLQRRFQSTLLAVSRSGQRITQRLSAVRLLAGDVVVLRGAGAALPDALGQLRVLPLAERSITFGRSHRSWLPSAVLLAAMACVVLHIAPVAVAFFAAAVILILLRFLTMEEAYQTVEWHVLILIGAMIPLSHAVRDTGGAELIASSLTGVVQAVPPLAALGLILVITMTITPFLHNAPTVLILGPIAATLAKKLHLNPDAFLMAVALGAGCDFLTPIGHQCNTLVMGPGGYRFSDYPRLGVPLSILVVVVGTPLIALVWPLMRA